MSIIRRISSNQSHSTPSLLRRAGGGSVALLLLTLASCVDNHILSPAGGDDEAQPSSIAFAASVSPCRTTLATRSDGSIINRLETAFPGPGTTYYQYAGEGVAPTSKAVDYGIGLYSTYTGPFRWHELMKLATTSFANRSTLPDAFAELKRMTEERAFSVRKGGILEEHYTAKFFYNQQASIGTPDGGSNPLTYTPERFWPNNKIGTSGDYERASFWAYYPWNAAGDPGEYGVHITSTTATGVGLAEGMGQMQFTMHPDASQQSDFMISDLVADCSKEQYPLQESTVPADAGWTPSRVPLRFHHMLAQVRLYAFIQGRDRVVYQKADETWYNAWPVGGTIKDDLGNVLYTKTGENVVTTKSGATMDKTSFLALNLDVPDESKTVRWWRDPAIRNIVDDRNRADISYTMSFNNIYTHCRFTPTVTYDAVSGTYKTEFPYTDVGSLGSATVNHYIMNPYWFRFYEGKRVMLNETYMYDYFEDTPAYRAKSMSDADSIAAAEAQDGVDWSNFRTTGQPNVLGYTGNTGYEFTKSGDQAMWTAQEVYDARKGKHYNYPPGNILLVVPQQLKDDDVPNITITAHGYQADADGNKTSTPITAKVTINMLQMNIKWEPGFIYCYAFLDELMPGDDKVRGPETITVVFDPTRETDQW
ncbi:MAG: hypothetical protein IJ142_02760 [Bacteroidaceae bacterium]|nr:hypothetical protein [Bacteroidaceae bacterium]